MGNISNDHEKFVVVNITLEDLFKADGNAVRFTLASLAVWFLRRAAPKVADQIKGNIHTMTDWCFNHGEFTVCVGKNGHEQKIVEADIKQYIQSVKS